MKRGFGRKSGKRKYGGDKGHGKFSGMGTRLWNFCYQNGQWKKKKNPKIEKPLPEKIFRIRWS